MLKKQFILLLSVIILHLFLSQSFAFIVYSYNHDNQTELSGKLSSTNKDSIQEFNISTHACLWSINKDESDKEESNLEIMSAIAYLLFSGFTYSKAKLLSIFGHVQNHATFKNLPVFILIQVFRI
jgi:hypothetical protein